MDDVKMKLKCDACPGEILWKDEWGYVKSIQEENGGSHFRKICKECYFALPPVEQNQYTKIPNMTLFEIDKRK